VPDSMPWPRRGSLTSVATVQPQMMLLRCWRAKSKPGKDTGSAHIGHMGATEDAAWRRFAAAGNEDDIV
jgi:hypothetical protein